MKLYWTELSTTDMQSNEPNAIADIMTNTDRPIQYSRRARMCEYQPRQANGELNA